MRLLAACILAGGILIATEMLAYPESEFLEFVSPPHLGLTLFANGYGNDQFGSTTEGFELEQSVTRYFSLVGRATAYQIYKGIGGYNSPLTPASRAAVRDFGRFQGGVDFAPIPGTSFVILGGQDVGDSNAPVIEGDLSSWLGIHTIHPVNIALVGSHYYENGVTAGWYDLREIVTSTADLLLLLGVGGAIWGGGTLPEVKAHGGPDVGIFIRRCHLNLEIQAGYGSAHVYGIVSASRQFGWDE